MKTHGLISHFEISHAGSRAGELETLGLLHRRWPTLYELIDSVAPVFALDARDVVWRRVDDDSYRWRQLFVYRSEAEADRDDDGARALFIVDVHRRPFSQEVA